MEPCIINQPPSPEQIQAIIDELGALDERLAPFKRDAKRYDALRKQILSWYEHVPAESAYQVDGTQFRVQVSGRQAERSIVSMTKLRKALGQNWNRVVRVAVTAVDALLTREQQAGLIETKPTGPRTLAVFRLHREDSKAA